MRMIHHRSCSASPADLWQPLPKIRGPAILAAAALMSVLLLAAFGGGGMGGGVFGENGPVETLQMVALLLSSVLFLIAGLRSRGLRGWLCVALSSALVLAVQREVPNCTSAYYEGGICAGFWTKGSMVALAASMVVLSSLLFRFPPREILRPRNLVWLWPLATSSALLGVSALAEHRLRSDVEELSELAAYIYLLAFAAWAWRSAVTPRAAAARGAPKRPAKT